jgi:hypothetical protein
MKMDALKLTSKFAALALGLALAVGAAGCVASTAPEGEEQGSTSQAATDDPSTGTNATTSNSNPSTQTPLDPIPTPWKPGTAVPPAVVHHDGPRQ